MASVLRRLIPLAARQQRESSFFSLPSPLSAAPFSEINHSVSFRTFSVPGKRRTRRDERHRAVRRRKDKRSDGGGQNTRADSGRRRRDAPSPPPPASDPPPALLHRTASPHVYVASSAAFSAGIDPLDLFAQCRDARGGPVVPPSFVKCRFEYASPKLLQNRAPTWDVPEVALIGRSNAGKSSLINALTGRADLARVSKRPGRTQQVNYFALLKEDGKRRRDGKKTEFNPRDATGFLIDLPGYGYAAAPVDVVERWQRTTQDFLLSRIESGNLAKVYLLIDGRRGIGRVDLEVMEWFDEAGIPYCITLTKTDRAEVAMMVKHANQACMRFHVQTHTGICQDALVHLTSSARQEGIVELKWGIEGDFQRWRQICQNQGGEWGKNDMFVSGTTEDEDNELSTHHYGSQFVLDENDFGEGYCDWANDEGETKNDKGEGGHEAGI